jgi:chromosome segregation ATPase
MEEKDLRRQRRLIKNRESASLSRQRRKEHMDDLEVQVAGLNAENDQLKARVEQLSAENVALRERLHYYEGKEQSPSLGERFRKLTKVNASPFSTKSSAATAGACLAVRIQFTSHSSKYESFF